jgi:hypothetical protein
MHRTALSLIFSIFLSYPTHLNPKPPKTSTSSPPPTHRSSPPSLCRLCRPSFHPHFSIFLFYHTTPTPPKFLILSPFLKIKRHIPIHGLCPFVVYVGFVTLLQGVGLKFKVGFETLIFRNAHQVFDEFPQPISSMPIG